MLTSLLFLKCRRRGVAQLARFVLGALAILLTLMVLLKTSYTTQQNLPDSQYLPHNQAVESGQTFSSNEKEKILIDWHDYSFIASEAKRTGPGEQGLPLRSTELDTPEKTALYRTNGFNAAASDKIALDRAVKDIRHSGCKNKLYNKDLPSVSIIVPFHNEHWSTLIRTVKSVLLRSPEKLIKEIILVDDFSSKDFLKEKLDRYIAGNLPKTKVVRASKREGLIRGRLLGARAASGDVLIFLDSHSEPNTNWLPPLLDPIADNYKTAMCPFIDVIDYDTFEYRAQDEGARGGFDWELYYKRLPLLPADLKNPTEPFKSPVMAGGLFAVSRKFFWELGGYDEGLDVWGGEQYELSFKIWQCGGQMFDAPCSRVGHIYRKYAPFTNPGVGDYVGRVRGNNYIRTREIVVHGFSQNYRRVAEVWMDEYADYLYGKRPHYKSLPTGDLTKQRKLRETLQCKPFKWFMTEVAFDLMERYPPIEPEDYASGEIRNVASNLCIDTRFLGENQRFGLKTCLKDIPAGGGEQTFSLTWHKDIRPKTRASCFDVSGSEPKSPVILFGCHNMQGNQLWNYRYEKKQLFHPVSNKCLDCDAAQQEIFMNACDEAAPGQKWMFSAFNATALDKLNSS